MAILDVFVSIFEAETKGLVEGQRAAEKSTDDLVKSMKDAEKQASDTSSKLMTFAKQAAGFLAAAFSVQQLIGTAIGQADTVAQMHDAAEAIGSAVDDLDAFNRSLGDLDVAAEASSAALSAVFENAQQAMEKTDGEQAKLFKSLGVHVKGANGQLRGAVEVMQDVAGAIEGMDKASATAKLKQLGISDPKMIEQLLRGRKALDEQMRAHKEAGVITKEQAEIAQKYKKAQADLDASLATGARMIMQAVLPAITTAVQWLTKLSTWVNQNKPFIVGFFAAIAAVIAAVYLPSMLSAAAATIAATWPLLLMGAAIAAAAAAIGLIVDDIYNWIQGNDSLLGQLINEYPVIGDIINAITDAVKYLGRGFGMLADVAVQAMGAILSGALSLGKAWGAMVNAMVQAIISGFGVIKNVVTGIVGWIFSQIQAATGAIKKVASFFGFGGGGNNDVQAANSAIAAANANPLNSTTSGAIANSTAKSTENNVTIGELKIETQATDAQGIAGATRSELGSQLKNLQAESNSGVER